MSWTIFGSNPTMGYFLSSRLWD